MQRYEHAVRTSEQTLQHLNQQLSDKDHDLRAARTRAIEAVAALHAIDTHRAVGEALCREEMERVGRRFHELQLERHEERVALEELEASNRECTELLRNSDAENSDLREVRGGDRRWLTPVQRLSIMLRDKAELSREAETTREELQRVEAECEVLRRAVDAAAQEVTTPASGRDVRCVVPRKLPLTRHRRYSELLDVSSRQIELSQAQAGALEQKLHAANGQVEWFRDAAQRLVVENHKLRRELGRDVRSPAPAPL